MAKIGFRKKNEFSNPRRGLVGPISVGSSVLPSTSSGCSGSGLGGVRGLLPIMFIFCVRGRRRNHGIVGRIMGLKNPGWCRIGTYCALCASRWWCIGGFLLFRFRSCRSGHRELPLTAR